jgi:hypothetical protein
MNGAAERLGQTIWRKAAPILKYARLDLKYWPEAVRHAAYLYLRSPHKAIQHDTVSGEERAQTVRWAYSDFRLGHLL